jgi:alkanesulfonate monooxygenase SsuD/methylene tetrahydromethanopterin reductase-like flavin-dependent oxidoreductase (luciferase family)
MGGYAPAVLRRTVREADGWYGWGLDPPSAASYIERLRTLEQVQGRAGRGSLEITVTPPDRVGPNEAARFEEAGVDRLNLMLPWGSDARTVERFFIDVVGPLVDAQARRV